MRKKISFFRILWYVILGFLILGYIIIPMLQTFLQALTTEEGYSFDVFQSFFSNPNQTKVIWNTVLLGILSVLTCGIIGIALAMYMTFLAGKGKKLIHILLLSPMMIPGVITVISFIQLYGESGILTKAIQYMLHLKEIPFQFQGLGAIVFVVTYTQYVYFYLNVYVALKYVDNSSIEAARSMGASWIQVFKDVIWPIITPAVLSSSIVTFASGISSFSAPNLIGGGFKVLSTQIVRSKANNHMDMASVQVVVLFLISMSVMLLIQYYSKRYVIQSSDRSTVVKPLSGRHSLLSVVCKVIVLFQILLIVLPILAIIYLSFVKTSSIMQDIFPRDFTLENYLMIFEKPRVLKPLVNSLKMAVMAVAAGLVITVPSTYMIVKFKGKFHSFLKMMLMLPWTMPASVIAINLINAFAKESIFSFNTSLIGGFYILPIAYTITALPLLINSNEVAIQGLNKNLEEASKSLGANMIYTFGRVILPNIAPGIMAGGVLVFIRTIGEYTMSALLYGVYNRPISISIVTNMQEYKVGLSLAYGVIVILICYCALSLIFKLDKKRFL
ncbi:ABC transporter permease [Drancourtella sp. An210]|nr:ABC transporter permease [Drancourtella sp. An210]OUP65863.1 ABC transporter permease [Drancourtella sp. An177]